MLRLIAILFGIFFIALGIAGFVPDYITSGKLFDIFRLNFEHNITHLATGIIALLCGISGLFASKMFFMIAGVVYAFLALFGFQIGEGMLFEMIAVNTADNILHAGIGATFLLIGFGFKS